MLKSVLVYSQSDGYRTIELRDASGNVLESKVLFLNIGEKRLDLQFMIDPGENYTLALNTTSGLYSHTSGAKYPYTVPGVLSITGSSKGLGPYFYFYDWEVQYENVCGRTRVEAVVDTGLMQAEFSMDRDKLLLPDTATVQFFDLSTNAQSWFWDFGDGQSSTQKDPSHTYTQPGTYVVGLSAIGIDGCSDAFSDTILVEEEMISTNVNNSLNDRIEIYPNPSQGIFTVIFDQTSRQLFKIDIFDLHGKQIISLKEAPYRQNQIQLDLSAFPNGMYYLHISSVEESLTKKLIKNH